MWVSDQTQAPAALPREKNSRYKMIKRPGGSQSRFGRGNEENNRYLCRESIPTVQLIATLLSSIFWVISSELVRDICRRISKHRPE
jgi:hypothetical protein